jgi:hypothetical protein
VALAVLHPKGVGLEALESLFADRLHQILGLKVAGLAGYCSVPVGVPRRQVFPIHHVHLQQITPWPQHVLAWHLARQVKPDFWGYILHASCLLSAKGPPRPKAKPLFASLPLLRTGFNQEQTIWPWELWELQPDVRDLGAETTEWRASRPKALSSIRQLFHTP